jgi:hypothetical protein
MVDAIQDVDLYLLKQRKEKLSAVKRRNEHDFKDEI